MSTGVTAVIDYGLCNIDSISRILEELGATVEKTSDPKAVASAARIVLPGVGSFGAAIRNLKEKRLDDAIRECLDRSDVPFLGICLGMQLMGSRSSEHGEHKGLGIVKASVERLEPVLETERIPHIGWNEVYANEDAELLRGIRRGADFYFVHSYHMKVEDKACELATTPYCGGIISAICVPGRSIFGTQFHPEKSLRDGQMLLRNFLKI